MNWKEKIGKHIKSFKYQVNFSYTDLEFVDKEISKLLGVKTPTKYLKELMEKDITGDNLYLKYTNRIGEEF